ncbi:hypothetical protein [Marinobacter changyiensis]|uniref:hypothetical protein n=1 Tax=Marinobacter changyiensis TaxID=2604091 RepID=UPI0015D2D9D4|nr:hypothetical protein [Marinobacter changyiensis]
MDNDIDALKADVAELNQSWFDRKDLQITLLRLKLNIDACRRYLIGFKTDILTTLFNS